jgi:hypothetical protein
MPQDRKNGRPGLSSLEFAGAGDLAVPGCGATPKSGWALHSRVTWLTVFLVGEVIAVAAFQAPMRRFDRFAILDSGGELVIQDLMRRGERPTIDFGYLYGLLPLLVGRLWYRLAGGLTPDAFRMEVMACAVLSAWGMARFAASRRVGPAGVVLIALAIPDLLRVTFIGFVQSLEQALLIHALAEQARGRRGTSLALLTACCFVKPSLAFVQGLAVLIALVAACRRADRAAWVRALRPAFATAAALAALLTAAFGLKPLMTTLLPQTGLEVYRLGGYGFFRGIGRDFWILPHAGWRDYFRYEVGFWMLATLWLTWGGLAGILRLTRTRSTRDEDETLADEVCATCAVVHLGFVLFLFGHRGTWFYSWPMLILGLATLARRGPWHRSALWVLALLLLVNDRSKAADLLRRWRTETPNVTTLNLWADPREQAEWARALEWTRGRQPVLLAMCEGGALLIPGFAPPTVGYLAPGNALPAEARRKAAQLAAATMVISAFPPDWPGFAFWPEIQAALEGCELIVEGEYLRVYRRATPSRAETNRDREGAANPVVSGQYRSAQPNHDREGAVEALPLPHGRGSERERSGQSVPRGSDRPVANPQGPDDHGGDDVSGSRMDSRDRAWCRAAMRLWPEIDAQMRRPVGAGLTWVVRLLLCTAPAVLFFGALGPGLCDPVRIYSLQHDDFEYVARSRTLPRAMENLFVPHSTHIVPAWRLLTWSWVACAGRLSRLPAVLAVVAYGVLVAVMLVTGRLVAQETGRTSAGLIATAAVGTTSLMMPAATWYSAGQTLWAGLGILATLVWLESWRLRGGLLRLALAAASAVGAGWLWTIGHLAGPVGAIFLWVDGDPRCRRAAVVPLAATAIAVTLAMAQGARRIDGTLNLHGRGLREAVDPVQGAMHTAQAIPENLIAGNLGLAMETTQAQGAVLSIAVILLWIGSRRDGRRFNPLECSGAALMLGSYLIEWTVRGYSPFWLLRLIVPWYHTIPQIGAVLFLSGWFSGPRSPTRPETAVPAPLTRGGVIGLTLLAIGLVELNRPRVEALWESSVLRRVVWEVKSDPGSTRKGIATRIVALARADWQRQHLVQLEQAEALGRRLGIGRDAIHRAWGRLDAPNLPSVYDAVDLLDLARSGLETDGDRIRRALGPFLAVSPEPRPPWLSPAEPWPPELAPAGPDSARHKTQEFP